MLSLPLLPPRDDNILWPAPTAYPSSFGPSSSAGPASNDFTQGSNTAPNPTQHQQPHHPSRRTPSNTLTSSIRSPLALLAADENTIAQRKQNVRRFGAGWLRPPGVPKTYQAAMDEAAEREEQEALARREAALLEMAGAAEAEAAAAAAAAGAGGGMVAPGEDNEVEDEEFSSDGEDEEEERDLDDDIPDAEDLVFNEESMVDGSSLVGVPEGGMVTTAGGAGRRVVSMIGDGVGNFEILDDEPFEEGSEVAAMLEMEEAEMEGRLQDERDLDDDVPEAGSYQHTDTEVEESSSELEESVLASGGRGARTGLRLSGGNDDGRRRSGPSGVTDRRSAFRNRLMQERRVG